MTVTHKVRSFGFVLWPTLPKNLRKSIHNLTTCVVILLADRQKDEQSKGDEFTSCFA